MNQASTFLARFLFLLLIIGIGISEIFGDESAEAYPVVVLESSFGLMFGTATQEVIFQDYKLSELDWSSIPLFYFRCSNWFMKLQYRGKRRFLTEAIISYCFAINI